VPGPSWYPCTQTQRVLCYEWHITCSARTGTGFSQLCTSAETVGLMRTLFTHGWPVHAMGAALWCDERTIADGWARSGRQGKVVQASLGHHHGNGTFNLKTLAYGHHILFLSLSPHHGGGNSHDGRPGSRGVPLNPQTARWQSERCSLV
jgi:hypothetical protein